jgi:hypothetical protein
LRNFINFVTGNHRPLALPTFLAFVALFASTNLWGFGFDFASYLFLVVAAIFGFIYIRRFSLRSEKRLFDYAKGLALLAYTLSWLPFFFTEEENLYELRHWEVLTPYFLLIIYFADRVTLSLAQWISLSRMNKKIAIVLIIQTILNLTFVTYAFIQKAQADKSRNEAIQAQAETVMQMKLAVENERIARELAARCDSLLQIQNSK